MKNITSASRSFALAHWDAATAAPLMLAVRANGMKLTVENDRIIFPGGTLEAQYPVIEARYIGERVVVVYDYMEFPKTEPARNLFAYNAGGELLWRAEDIGQGATDAYTNVLSEHPLKVGNFAGFSVHIDVDTGRVLSKVFTK